MKRVFTILLVCFTCTLIAQPCLPEGITFTTQEQIDNFQINNPGCTEIEGDVLIQGENIYNLDGLSSLVTIGGNLNINENHSLYSLAGFQNISYIGEDLIIWGNPILTNLTGLNNINSVFGELWIGYNDSLLSFEGLNNLYSIGDFVWISDNILLQYLSGLENLYALGNSITISNNPSLKSISSLYGLNYVVDWISIINNDSLTSLSGLENVAVNSIDNLHIADNGSLSDCNTVTICNYLASPNGVVDIHNNADGCNSHAEVANTCGIEISCLPYGNYYFTTQEEIDNFNLIYSGCSELKGNVVINDSYINAFINLNGLNAITSIEGYLLVNYNTGLTNLTGLNNVNIIGKGLSIHGNTFLESLDGLDYLNTIGGSIRISSNSSITSLEGLSNVTSMNGNLIITQNYILSSLSGLENIDASTIHRLEIYYNHLLTDCAIESICESLNNPYLYKKIQDNAAGCNSKSEIETLCDTLSIPKTMENIIFTMTPNPTKNWLYIKHTNSNSVYTIELRNLYGQLVREEKNIQSSHYPLNVADLKAGVYFYAIKEKGLGVQQGKIIKK